MGNCTLSNKVESVLRGCLHYHSINPSLSTREVSESQWFVFDTSKMTAPLKSPGRQAPETRSAFVQEYNSYILTDIHPRHDGLIKLIYITLERNSYLFHPITLLKYIQYPKAE